ncbi:DUF11 domain-containing protein [Vibrio sp. ZSDE26]|uniref:DUF11 domain-containing protein n=1 Tax=Vibrio amylolyticus TaxID=2847292 RepID=A0A9X2BHD5_9VIBR|nr:DUF11 domain-containing protein [Vibrio amylolyticus]MCK6263704.1 DUF11 domain-containing protein [Vibrio amylolyticus]
MNLLKNKLIAIAFVLLNLISFSAFAAKSIEVSVFPTDAVYENGQTIAYDIQVKNTTKKVISSIDVQDLVWDTLSPSQTGSSKAFIKLSITDSHSWGSSAGSYNSQDSNLVVSDAKLFPLGQVTYHIEATVSDDIVGEIVLGDNTVVKAAIDGANQTFSPASVATFSPVPYEYSIDLSVDKSEYLINQKLTYTLKLINTGSYRVQHLNIEQPYASLKALSASGSTVSAFNSVVISGVTFGNGSDAGSYASSGDLVVKDASIDVGGSITYTISAEVVDGLVGDIVTQAVSSSKEGDQSSDELTTPAAKPKVEISHTISSVNPYLVNQERVFTVVVYNNGKGIAHDYHVKQNIAQLITNNGLANDLESHFDNSDVSGQPFSSWKVKVSDIGSHSLSDYNATGEQTDVDVEDTVSIYPNESISYTITANLTPVTIGDIAGFNASVEDSSGRVVVDAQINEQLSAEQVLYFPDPDIKVTKTTQASEYIPGQNVEYDIKVSNSSSKYFANNLLIVDDLTCVQTEQAAGAGVGQAFSQWKLEVVSGEDDQGTDPGLFNYNQWMTSEVTLSPDIAPGKEVHYRLTAQVNDSSVGLIVDNRPSCHDDISEDGSGVQMPEDNLRASKVVDSRYYSSGQTLTYTIQINNDGDGFADQVSVFDDLENVMTTGVSGKDVNAYASWEITAVAKQSDGSISTASDTGISSSISNPDILDVKATIAPHSYIEYTIVAQTNPLANGHIKNSVTVDNTVYADTGSDPYDFDIEIDKRVKVGSEGGYHDEGSRYSKLDDTVMYQINVVNRAGNGYATNVQIKDEISKITAGLLEPNNETKPVFSSWTISAEIISDNPLLNGNGLFTDVGTFSDNSDLNTTAQIPPNVTVVYTIVGKIDRSVSEQIVYSKFTNVVEAKTPDSDSQTSATDSVTIWPKDPDVVVVKTSEEEKFVPGQWVTFDIMVYNRGSGYANEVKVDDDIIGMNVFERWEITSKTDSNNTTYKTGSYAGSKSNYPDNGNINTKIDIDPKTSDGLGFVGYTIRGLVRSDYEKFEIANTVEIHDPVNNLDQSSTAEIGDSGDSKLNVSILKTADRTRFTPGDEVTYFITLLNNSSVKAEHLKVFDPLNEIRMTLANQKDNHFADFPNQSPFESWQFDYADGKGWSAVTNDDFVYPLGGDNKTFSLEGGEERTFKIKAKVKDNVVSNILGNDAYVYRDKGLVSQEDHVSHHEMERVGSGADVVRKLYVNGVETSKYAPGDTLKYTVKISSQVGYFNNHRVSENIKDLSVLLMDGTTANPFNSAFTVGVEKEDDNGAAGTTDGTLDGVVSDNENIETTIDVAGGDYVLYTVEGVVRDDAVGDITIGGITVRPFDYHLTFTKTVDQKNYEPGQPLTYKLTIKNDAKGNAYNIPIVDELSQITVDLLDGNKGPAFDTGWTISTEVVGGSSAAIVDLDSTLADNQDINTHFSIPGKETIIYTVTGNVNPQAVGNITNLLLVDGNTVSAESKPNTEKFTFEKHVTRYFDQDGTTELTGGYTPGGYIEYQIDLVNKNNVHLKDVRIIDAIDAIKTDYFDGTKGAAFSEWTIETETDSSGYSDAGTVKPNQNISTEFDLSAPSFTSDGNAYVRYIIKAKVAEQAVGEIKNTALVDDRHTLISERSRMLLPEVKFTHHAYTNALKTEVKSSYNHTPSEQPVVYQIRIDNKGKGTEYGATLVDELSKLKVKLAQQSAADSDGRKESVYEPKTWNVSVGKSNELVTQIGSFSGGVNTDINIPELSIAAGGWVDLTVETEIRNDSLEKIYSKAKYVGSITQNRVAKVEIEPSKLDVTKEIISIGGRAYSSGDTYKPGEEVVYRLTVDNTESVWYDNAAIVDKLSDIKVEVLGGGTEQAFTTTEITHTLSGGLGADFVTYIPDYSPSGDLNISVDVAPKAKIVFTIKGQIRPDALGSISANRATGGNHHVDTDAIPPVAPNLVFEKWVTNTTADSSKCRFPSTSGDGCQYNPNGEVTYTILVKNTGEGIANDATIVDKLNSIKTSSGESAFTSSNTSILKQPPSDRFSISGNYQGAKPLDATFDLMPNDEVVFQLTGAVNGDATGTITNVAKINGENSNEVILGQGDANILAAKMTDTPTYVPGGEVRYTLYIANKSDSNADVLIEDEISKFMVETADGSMKPALESWTVSAQFISNASADHNNIATVQTTGDINATVGLGAAESQPTVLEISIVGKVRTDAVGKFGNTMYVDKKQFDLREHFIYPEQGELTLTKSASLSPNTYAPGDVIGFDIEVKNEGFGYVQGVTISDIAKEIEADVIGGGTGQVFEHWEAATSSVSIVDSGSSKTYVIKETALDAADGFVGNYTIAPNSSIKLHLEGKVDSKVIGVIENTAKVEATNNKKLTANAEYVPIDADVTLSKVVDIAEYNAGDTLTYTLTMANTTRAWASDVRLQDFVSQIEAESISGSMITVFESGSIDITALSSTGESILPSSVGDNIDALIQIAPEDVITVTISGTLKTAIIGDVVNKATLEFDGKTIEAEAVSVAAIPEIEITKNTIEEFYKLGRPAGYAVTITNKSGAFANDIQLIDEISALMVETTDAASAKAFATWSVAYKASDKLTVVDAPKFTHNKDIDTNIDLAPDSQVLFVVEGRLNPLAIGEIENIATATFNRADKESSAMLKPLPASISVTKIADREFYQAGDIASFTVTVTNEGDGFANDVSVKDLLNDMQVELVDGSRTTAFEQWRVTTSWSNPLSSVATLPSGKNPDIDTLVDLAPNSTVEFLIEGRVQPLASSDIYNKVTVGYGTQPELVAEAIIKNRPVSLTLEKFVGEQGAETEMTYEPGKEATFRVVLKNQNESFVGGIALKDIISGLKVATVNGAQEKAFSSWAIKVNKGNNLTTVSPDPSGANKDIDATVSLAPNDTLELVITGTINEYANGRIDNKASMTVDTRSQRFTATASLIPEPDNVVITKTADSPIYVAGEEATFRIKLFNDSKGFGNDIVVKDVMSQIRVPTRPDEISGDREVIQAFTKWTVEAKSGDPRTQMNVHSFGDNQDIEVGVDIAPNDTAELIITGTVDPRAMGEIVNTAYKIDEVSQDDNSNAAVSRKAKTSSNSPKAGGASVEVVSAMIVPEAVMFNIDKTTTKGENAQYTNDDEDLTYVLNVGNEGSALISGVEMLDEITKLTGGNGNLLFSEWSVVIREFPGNTVRAEFSNKDLHLPDASLSLDLLPYLGNRYEITISGLLNKGLDDDITNTFTVTDPATGKSASDDVTIHVKKFSDNEGELIVTKQALKEEAQVGDVIEYEVIIQNNNESEFKNVKLVDRYPAGFEYVQGSTELTNSGPDGEFDTGDDTLSTADPAVTNDLVFNVGDMLAYGSGESSTKEQIRIRYLLRVSVGATFGNYVNTAVAKSPPPGESTGALVVRSSVASATVEITPDKVFDTASIIGKVFEDHNQDGFQADATAFDIIVTAQIDDDNYIAGTTTLTQNDEKPVADITHHVEVAVYGQYDQDEDSYQYMPGIGDKSKDSRMAKTTKKPTNVKASKLTQGIEVSRLFGISRNRTLPEGNTVSIQFKARTKAGIPFTVETDEGTFIEFDAQGNIVTHNTSDKADGLSAENLDVTRNLYKDGEAYLWEILIENKGLYEDGIPGVRLLTVEGIIIETDQYGRYHVPDQWVLNKKGKQFLIKVDTDSLPTGMKVLSENPLVKRVSPNALTKFNFSVHTEHKDEAK